MFHTSTFVWKFSSLGSVGDLLNQTHESGECQSDIEQITMGL
jgi:hypothetical protein